MEPQLVFSLICCSLAAASEGGSRWRWHPGARRRGDRLLQLLPEGSRRRWHPSARRRCDRLLELLQVGSHDVACYGVSWLLEVVICHLGGCGGTLGVLTGSCGSGRFYFGSGNTCCPVLVTSCGPSPFNWSGDVTVLRDGVTRGVWPCCLFYGRGCLYPSVLSAEMLLSSRKCLVWFDGRETWLERGGVGSGCVC